ncbi:hypothetical protein J7E87_34355 [Streptomyces sp. ISL-1]|uniref:hypothetical protein n=1 Tax=Streptomyces sp. ISL-1 TaxID=2817657 RepID=UPI001BEC5F98|nr:hypothetical protein [Streptomyces sp. ISL-1]MBT2394349.1 hypothetical protein [Streptomyces sp. ISL-1]
MRDLQEGRSVLCPEVLLGVEQVPQESRARIARELERIMEARGGLLHACRAFNALYLGYDPTTRRYAAEPDPDSFLEVRACEGLPVLPAGSFVRLTRGAREVWGEIVAVFGRRDAVEQDGWTAAALSGAPAASDTDEQRLLIDTSVFGPLSADEAVELGRWLRPGGGLEHGHLIGAVPAAVGEVSSRDQIGSHAAFLSGAGRGFLELGPLPSWLDKDADAETVAWAVRSATTCVADIMASSRTIRTWGLYGRPASAVQDFAGSERAQELRRSVSRPGPGGAARYSALWPLLTALAGDAEDGRPQPLSGVAGAAQVVDANLALADAVTGHRYRSGVDVRLDDRWLEGGVWRAQAEPVTALLAGLDPLTPAGIGFAESAPTAQDLQQARGLDAGASRVQVEHVDDELVVLTVFVGARDFAAGRLELTQPVKKLLPEGQMILHLHHDGEHLSDEAALQRARPAHSGVTGVTWPSTMYPGVRLTVAAARAGRRLVATSMRLAEPVPVEGFGPVRWECDWTLFAYGLGLPAWSPDTAAPQRWQPSVNTGAWRPAVAALEHLIVEALKRDGTIGPAGSRSLHGRRLTASLFGADMCTVALLWTVIHTCEDMAVLGLLTQTASNAGEPDVFTWWPDTPEAWEARKVAEWGGDGLPETAMNRHWVRPRERRLPSGQRASPESRAAYARWRLDVEGRDAETELPPGTTFVHGHLRGTGPGQPWHRHLTQHEQQERRSANG